MIQFYSSFHRIVSLLLFVLCFSRAQEEISDFQKQAALFSQKCSKCHTVGKGDRVGPDLKGVHQNRDRKWLLGFIRQPSLFLESDSIAVSLLSKYQGVRMPDLNLNSQEVDFLIEYIATASEGGALESTSEILPPEKKQVVFPDEGLTVSPGGVVLTLLLWGSALVFKLRSKQTISLTLLFLSLGMAYWSFGGRHYHQLVGSQQGYEPQQPIEYSHKLHAGQLEISCLYCHHGAEKSATAGVPSVNVCMNCHRVIQKVSPELQKLNDIWATHNTKTPKTIEWIRVHRLPDFVYFNHQAHVQNNISCQECHGPVEEMDRIRQASDLSMGFCLNCHRHEGKPAPSHWKRAEGPQDCSSCHQ